LLLADFEHTLYISSTRYSQYVHSKVVTAGSDVAIRPRMGRKKRWPERVGAKFAAGTLKRVAAVLADREERTAFIREAVEREIERRESAHKRKRGRLAGRSE
jgi:hypothetical protein